MKYVITALMLAVASPALAVETAETPNANFCEQGEATAKDVAIAKAKLRRFITENIDEVGTNNVLYFSATDAPFLMDVESCSFKFDGAITGQIEGREYLVNSYEAYVSLKKGIIFKFKD